MKFVAVAVVAAAFAAVANADSCDVTSLETLLTSTDTTTCASDSGYAVTSLSTPTDAEMAIMCTSTACQSVLSQLEELAPTECTLGTFALYADLVTPLSEYCGGSSTGSSTTSTVVGSTTGSATDATITATSTTGSSATTTTTTSGSSDSTQTTASASAAASASASTAGSSGASMAAVSAGAVFAAVAATLF
ncbi:hypothetical protein BBJ28_00009646 [Nothophytophthora sp. Chile5]|nr:hypothetical protein BBJ28_00009646 [Nothophytophthora sp. Chile5]